MSNFKKIQACKILSCYQANDIEKGGKRAEVGEVRIWGGKKYIKAVNGWMNYETGNKKIDNSRRNKEITLENEKIFSEDRVILDHIKNLSDSERKELVYNIKNKITLLEKKRELLEKEKEIRGEKLYNIALDSTNQYYIKELKKLRNKLSEIEYGGLSKEEMEDKIQSIYNAWKKDKTVNESEINRIEQALFRHHLVDSKIATLEGGGRKLMFNEHSLLNDNTPWTEEMLNDKVSDEDIKEIEDKIKNVKKDYEKELEDENVKKLQDLKSSISNRIQFYATDPQLKTNLIPEQTKIKVSFSNGKNAERTWGQMSEYVQRKWDEWEKNRIDKTREYNKKYKHLWGKLAKDKFKEFQVELTQDARLPIDKIEFLD